MSRTRTSNDPRGRVSTRSLVTIGQAWRRRSDRSVWTVQMPHRHEGTVEMVRETPAGPEHITIELRELRRKWRLLDGAGAGL